VAPTRTALEQRKQQALRDLRQLDAQVRAGEIDQPAADRLRTVYEAEAGAAITALADADMASAGPTGSAPDDPTSQAEEPAATRSRARSRRPSRRVLAGVGFVLAGIIGIGLALGDTVLPRPPGAFITGVEVGGPPLDDPTVDIGRLEAAVEAFPDLTPMRLQLAHRYLEQQELDAALEHYLAVLDREPHPEALSRVGWITFLSGEPQLAAQLLEESLAREPDDPIATWFLANVRLYGLDDPAGAVPLLEDLLARDDLPDQARSEVGAALDEARDAEANR
jgi:tetratricopeptide (TPR) repeat protein